MRFFRSALISIVAVSSSVAYSAEVASLKLSAPDLSSLRIGNSVSVDVNLIDLPAGATIDYLAATLSFDSALFDKPTIFPGSLIPDDAAFTSHSEFGLVDAAYDSLLSATAARVDH